MFARSTAVRSIARQGRNFTSTSASRSGAGEKAASAAKETVKKAQEIAPEAKSAVKDAANKVQEVAPESAKSAVKDAANKVQEVTPEGAQSAINNISKKAQEIGGPVMKRVEGLLGGYSEPIKYNLSVAGSIAKQVYVAESLAPPTSLQSVTSAYRQIWSKASDKSFWADLLTKGNWKQVGIYAVEAYGIFTIGEMIGRRSLVGYKLDTSKHGNLGHH